MLLASSIVLVACRPRDSTPIVLTLTAEARRRALDELERARATGDPRTAAGVNARLARDARLRARRVLDFWMARRDPESGLWAHSQGPARWVPQHTGADLWPHLLVAARELAPDAEPAALAALARERAVCGPLPCTVLLFPARAARLPETSRLAQAAEYAADGLLPPAERYGAGPWFDRLSEVARAIVDALAARGLPAAGNAETDGNLLQVLARLTHATRDERLAAAAERIADVYLLEWIPAAGGLPPLTWDFERAAPAGGHFRFRDHGAEILPGLAELYLAECVLGRPAAARHRAPLGRLLARALEVERASDGLWRDDVDRATGVAHGGPIDTWGYVLNAYAIADLARSESAHRETVESMMSAAAARAGFAWEGASPDGPADAIESMLLLLPFFPSAAGATFVEHELPAIFRSQDETGAAGAGYLDGNVVRSALLYAGWKSAGVSARPPRDDLALGAELEPGGDSVTLHLEAAAPWSGRLVFDAPRHRTLWSMPFDYPRRNGLPEWLAIDARRRYVVTDPATGADRELAGSELLAGLPMELADGSTPTRLRVRAAGHAAAPR